MVPIRGTVLCTTSYDKKEEIVFHTVERFLPPRTTTFKEVSTVEWVGDRAAFSASVGCPGWSPKKALGGGDDDPPNYFRSVLAVNSGRALRVLSMAIASSRSTAAQG